MGVASASPLILFPCKYAVCATGIHALLVECSSPNTYQIHNVQSAHISFIVFALWADLATHGGFLTFIKHPTLAASVQ